ncbi:unnamed protein product [Ceutorhynchus assimilis]|uniref:Protein windpipe n=1 Tax=Ceutorhynchus assimilis TaxID=467358 RepID=A0A9P0DGD5_9CUCU|nr:unnamed protein product [Ceutorhynchus assimilis]
MMWTVAVTLFMTAFAHASPFHCPDETICHEEGAIEANSFQFLNKLGPKQYQSIIKLTVVNASQDKLPAKLKYLRKLEYLDLSDNNIQLYTIPSLPHLKTLRLCRNNIKGIQFRLLPRNLEELDLSNNLLSHIPKDWSSLRALKILNLQKNFLDCDCLNNNVFTYKRMMVQGINISEDVNCYLPKQYYGKNINSINCTIEDEMINDQPEGSGASEDIFNRELLVNAPYLREEGDTGQNEVIDDKDEFPQERQFLVAEDILPINTAEEGSGDMEGSGLMPIEIEHVAACVYNCATPEPIGAHDDKNDSSAPDPTDQIKIIAEDVFQPIFAEPTSSTSTSTSIRTEVSLVEEETAVKSTNSDVYAKPRKDSDVDLFLNETHTGEMKKATALNQNNYAVYIVLTCGLLLTVVFSVYLIKKRRAKKHNKNRRGSLARYEEEMTPLEKPPIKSVNEKNGKSPSGIPEHIPLINGQNGKPRDEPILTSFTPLEHPELNGMEADEPAIRHKPELLTPFTQRVTVRASEIPESILKTPVLVHRKRNSDGEIVTRVLPP